MNNREYTKNKKIIVPEELNRNEILNFYKYSGPFKNFRLNLRLIHNFFLQMYANFTPSTHQAVLFQRKRGVNIGNFVYIGPNVHLDLLYPQLITIEDFVTVGMNSSFFVHSNPNSSLWLKKRHYPRIVQPIKIETGSWIAPNCTFLSGVTIGHHSVVAANSLVTKSYPPFSLIAGNPARLVQVIEH